MLDRASIVIPTYNESTNLPTIVNTLTEVSPKVAEELEIIVVDDNSPDGTGDIAEGLAAKYPSVRVVHRPEKMGVGSAIFEGVKAASAPYVVTMDADLHHSPEFVPSITRHLPEYDIVIASRFVGGSKMEATSLWRRLATRHGNALAKGLLNLNVKDYTHGFRGYKRSAFLECYHPEDSGGEFNLRILIEAQKRGYRALEVPYASNHPGRSKMRDWLRYLWILVAESQRI